MTHLGRFGWPHHTKDAVTSAKVKDGSLLTTDLAAGRLQCLDPIAPGAEVTVFVICPNGKRALGGGPETSPPVDLDIIYSGAFSDSSWAVRVASDGNFGPGNVRIWAVCGYVA